MRPLIILAIMCLLSTPLHGQWSRHGGSADLKADAPRTADGKPDLSGIWDIEHNVPCQENPCDNELGYEYHDIGWGIHGLPYQSWAAELVRKRTATHGMDDPTSHCLPVGIVKGLTTPLFRKIVQTPGLIIILSENEASYRQIFTDGRALPAIDQPTFNGYSVGKWEGDTLVVQSIGFKDGMWLDRNGSPLTDAAKITERYRRVNFGKLEIELMVDDPKAYTKPWTVKLNHFLNPDSELLDSYCIENEKDAQRLLGK